MVESAAIHSAVPSAGQGGPLLAPNLATSSAPGQRRRQLPWVGLGLMLVAGSMVGFALWSLEQNGRTQILVAEEAIEAGQTIERSDLSAASVAADSNVTLLRSEMIANVVGQRSRGPIPAGTPISAGLVADGSSIPEGMAVVGAVLGPGDFPTELIQAGDEVLLVETADSAAVEDSAGPAQLGRSSVWVVEELVGGAIDGLMISLLVPQADAVVVRNAAKQERLSLVLVGAEQ